MTSPQKLLYSLVARGTTVLAEHSAVSGNANLIAVRILEKLPVEETRRVSYAQDRHMFHVLTCDGVTFLCMAEESCGRRIPFIFLDDVKTRFMANYGAAISDAVAYEYNTEFSTVLAERASFYCNDPASDAITRVKGEILEVKGIMIQNIDKVLDRGEKLDVLVDKVESLQEGAFGFRREARRLKNTLWWRNIRLWLVVGLVLVALAYLMAGLACGFTLQNC